MSNPPVISRKRELTVNKRLILAGVVVVIYLIACCCPAFHFDKYYPGDSAPQSTEIWFGWTALVLGWIGFFVGTAAWLANLTLGLALLFLLLGLRWATLITSGITLLLSLDLFALFPANIPADEGGVGRAVLQPFMAGVWFWFASIVASFVVAWVLFFAPRTR